jgi:hypothetical protein
MRAVADICNRDTTCFLRSENPNFNVMYTKTSKNKKKFKYIRGKFVLRKMFSLPLCCYCRWQGI